MRIKKITTLNAGRVDTNVSLKLSSLRGTVIYLRKRRGTGRAIIVKAYRQHHIAW